MNRFRISKKQMERVRPYIPEAYDLLKTGRISRREFLRGSVLTGMGVGSIWLLGGCGTGAAPTQAPAAPTEAPAATATPVPATAVPATAEPAAAAPAETANLIHGTYNPNWANLVLNELKVTALPQGEKGPGKPVGLHKAQATFSQDSWAVAGAIDNTAAAIGAGTVRDGEPHLYLGTSSWIAAHVRRKKTDVSSQIASVPCAFKSP